MSKPSTSSPTSSFADCGGPFDLTAEHTISCWETQPTSGAERTIINYLISDHRRFSRLRLLHVGIGNCDLATTLMPGLAEYIGITISDPEIALFKQKFPNLAHSAILLNKYDPRMYAKLDGQFDLIIDTLLKSVACCEKHFRQMMAFYATILKTGGALITTESGLAFGWFGNTGRAYTPGSEIDPSFARLRTLDRDDLACLAESLGLTMTASATTDSETGDRIILLAKDKAA
jgi:hypothetical protein